MNVFIGRIDHAPESKLAPTFAREESPEKKEKFAPITKFLIGASYIHHEVLDCFPFFCCLSFLELVNSGSHTIRQTLDCETIRELDCPFLSMRQRHSLHGDAISARFEFFQSLLSRKDALPPISYLAWKELRIHFGLRQKHLSHQ